MQLGAIKLLQFKKIGVQFSFSEESINLINPSSPYPLKPFLFEVFFILLRFAAFLCCLKAFSIDSFIPISRWIFIFS